MNFYCNTRLSGIKRYISLSDPLCNLRIGYHMTSIHIYFWSVYFSKKNSLTYNFIISIIFLIYWKWKTLFNVFLLSLAKCFAFFTGIYTYGWVCKKSNKK